MSTVQRWASGRLVYKKPQRRELKKAYFQKRKHLRRNDRLFNLLFN